MLIDTCRTEVDSTKRSDDKPDPESVATDALFEAMGKAKGLVVMYGANKGAYSFDDPKAKNGVFTSGVLAALTKADPSPEGIITVGSIARYVNAHVYRWTRDNQPNYVNQAGIAKYISSFADDMPVAFRRTVTAAEPLRPTTYNGRCPPGVIGDCKNLKDSVLIRLAGLRSTYRNKKIFVIAPSGGYRRKPAGARSNSMHYQGLAVDVGIEGLTTVDIANALIAEGFVGIGHYFDQAHKGLPMAHGDLRGTREAKEAYGRGKSHSYPACWRRNMRTVERDDDKGILKVKYGTTPANRKRCEEGDKPKGAQEVEEYLKTDKTKRSADALGRLAEQLGFDPNTAQEPVSPEEAFDEEALFDEEETP